MAKVFIEETTLTAIGNAIRSKTGKSELIDPANMSTEIASIQAGSGGGGIPEEALTITGNCGYRFAYGGWDWFIETYGDKITTEGISSLLYAFSASEATKIPFVINIRNCSSLSYCFSDLQKLTECPKIRGTIEFGLSTSLASMTTTCKLIRDLEDLFEPEMLDGFSSVKITSSYSAWRPTGFSNNYSLRRVPSWWYKFILCEESTVFPSYTYCLYNNTFNSCYSLDEVLNMPVWRCQGAQTSNMFSSTFNNCCRIKDVTFETDNGQPIVTNWKTQTIDFSKYAGISYGYNYIINNNSGITADKEVKDDATYQALKNDPDWWTNKVEYSRYNHDSAVNTINSLPDTSAYLASAGGTNTIKFTGSSGSLTDGGAINTLTEAEIAVAAAKGWTVTLV